MKQETVKKIEYNETLGILGACDNPGVPGILLVYKLTPEFCRTYFIDRGVFLKPFVELPLILEKTTNEYGKRKAILHRLTSLLKNVLAFSKVDSVSEYPFFACSFNISSLYRLHTGSVFKYELQFLPEYVDWWGEKEDKFTYIYDRMLSIDEAWSEIERWVEEKTQYLKEYEQEMNLIVKWIKNYGTSHLRKLVIDNHCSCLKQYVKERIATGLPKTFSLKNKYDILELQLIRCPSEQILAAKNKVLSFSGIDTVTIVWWTKNSVEGLYITVKGYPHAFFYANFV